jgi:hypothetical protein
MHTQLYPFMYIICYLGWFIQCANFSPAHFLG